MKGGIIADDSRFEFIGIDSDWGRDVGVTRIALRGIEWQSDLKPSTLLRVALEHHPPPMRCCNASGDRQAQPGASLAAC